MRPAQALHRVTEFSLISEHIIIGTNMCCNAHAGKLRTLRFDADLDVELERSEAPPAVSAYLWLPVKNHAVPTLGQLSLGANFIGEIVRRRKKVYIHCQNGHGRAPTFAAAYYITLGMSTREAVAFVRSRRPEAHPETAQVRRLKKFERHLQLIV